MGIEPLTSQTPSGRSLPNLSFLLLLILIRLVMFILGTS